MASFISSAEGFTSSVCLFAFVAVWHSCLPPGRMIGGVAVVGLPVLREDCPAFLIGASGPYLGLFGGGVFSASGNLCVESHWGCIVILVWCEEEARFDFGKDGSTAVFDSRYFWLRFKGVARIAVCVTFVSNLGFRFPFHV